MKKLLGAIVGLSLMLSACADPLTVDNKTYPTYGLLNEGQNKDPSMCYKTSVGNVVWGILLIETIIAPIYLFGFSINEPVGKVNAQGKCDAFEKA